MVEEHSPQRTPGQYSGEDPITGCPISGLLSSAQLSGSPAPRKPQQRTHKTPLESPDPILKDVSCKLLKHWLTTTPQFGGSPIKVGEEEYSIFRDHEYVVSLPHDINLGVDVGLAGC